MGTYTLDRRTAHELKYSILHTDYKAGMTLPPERVLYKADQMSASGE